MTKISSMAGMLTAMAVVAITYPVRVEAVNDQWQGIELSTVRAFVPGLGKVLIEVESEASMARLFNEIEQLNFLRGTAAGEDSIFLSLPVAEAVDDPASEADKAARAAAEEVERAAAEAAAQAAQAAGTATTGSGKKSAQK